MIRIVCTVTNDLTFDQRMIRICTSLSDAGYAVELNGRVLIGSLPLSSAPFRQYRLRCWFRRGIFFYAEYNIRLFCRLLFRPADIICGVDLDTLPAVWLAARCKGAVCVYDAHEYFSEVPEVMNRPFVRRVWEWMADILIPRVEVAYTVADELAGIFRERYGKTFAVVRNMPHRQLGTPVHTERKDQPRILLYQGAVNMGRGLEALIQSMEFLPGFSLWIAGDGDIRADLERKASEQKGSDHIVFLGKCTPAQLRELTPRAWLGLNLLENKGLNYYYSLANKCFDYVQAGVPVLQMAFPEYIRLNATYETAVLLDDLDPKRMADAIRALAADELRYRHLVEQCRLAAEEWNWEQEKERLLAIYDGIAKGLVAKKRGQ